MDETADTKPKTRKTSAAKAGAADGAAEASMASETAATAGHTAEAKAKFSKALEEAKAGVAALGAEAHDRASAYKDQMDAKSKDWQSDAKVYGEQAKGKAADLAREGKAKASEAMATIGSAVADSATAIDEKLGPKYGDYARTAARHIQSTATSLDEKSIEEIGSDAKEFVRKSPGLAVGLAAAAGFFVSRLFSSKKS